MLYLQLSNSKDNYKYLIPIYLQLSKIPLSKFRQSFLTFAAENLSIILSKS